MAGSTRHLGRLVACPWCDGPRRSDRGGVAWGGCPMCDGAGLLLQPPG